MCCHLQGTLELSHEKTVKLPNRLTDLTAFSRKIQHSASGCVSGVATLLLSAQPMGTSAWTRSCQRFPPFTTIFHHNLRSQELIIQLHHFTSMHHGLYQCLGSQKHPFEAWGTNRLATRPAISSSGIRCEMIELPTGAQGVAQKDTGLSLEIRTFGYWYAATSNTSIPVRTRKQNVQRTPELGVHFVTVPLQLLPAPAHSLWWAIGAKFITISPFSHYQNPIVVSSWSSS